MKSADPSRTVPRSGKAAKVLNTPGAPALSLAEGPTCGPPANQSEHPPRQFTHLDPVAIGAPPQAIVVDGRCATG